MASLPNTKLVTYEEWLELPEVSEGIEEVVNGEIQIMPTPKWKHATIIENLRDMMAPQIDRQFVRIAVSQFGLVIRKRPLTTRVPDLAVFERSSIVERDGYIHSAPQLIVEVLSPANRREEREGKLADYASIGVAEVWVFSPEARTVEILALEGNALRLLTIIADGMLRPIRFPYVQIDIASIWPD
jgi:Uma2 family endonuclease